MQQFYQRFHGRAQVTPTAKELTQATALLTTQGWEPAQYLLTFSHQAAQATRYDPQVFGGILHYTDRALAAYDAQAARATQGPARRAAADERTQREQYQAWEQQQLAGLRAALPPQSWRRSTPRSALAWSPRAPRPWRCPWRCGWPSTRCWRRRPGCPPSRPGDTGRRRADDPTGC